MVQMLGSMAVEGERIRAGTSGKGNERNKQFTAYCVNSGIASLLGWSLEGRKENSTAR